MHTRNSRGLNVNIFPITAFLRTVSRAVSDPKRDSLEMLFLFSEKFSQASMTQDGRMPSQIMKHITTIVIPPMPTLDKIACDFPDSI